MSAVFDPTAPLPAPGAFLSLEASAGTGKTWSVATLAARYLIEQDLAVGQVMVITFSRASTQELRDRVRRRLEACVAVLAGGAEPDDDVLAALAAGDAGTLARRRERAEAALRDFDRAAIFTTHGFCDSMLRRLGVLVDHDPGDRLVPDLMGLARQASADEYLARFGLNPEPPVAFGVAAEWGRQAVLRSALPLVRPEAAPLAADFAAAVRDRVRRAQRAGGLYTYDDMLTRLRDALAEPGTGPAAAGRLSSTYPVVLVDEFQDTDPVQWEILERAFLGRSVLVVIGDPKQSIYGFRGADVQAYLAATAKAGQAGLGVNRRSAPALVTAVGALMGDRPLGHDRIRVTQVATSASAPRLIGAEGTPWAVPVRLRVPPDGVARPAAEARQLIDSDLVADIAALLNADLELQWPGGPARPLEPDDVAILVTSNARGQAILDQLAQAGIPAVFTGAQSVLASPAAADWAALLKAVAEPRTAQVRAAALTGLIGWSLDDLVRAGPDDLAGLALTLRLAGLVLAQNGPVAALELLADRGQLAARLAGTADGGRRWTDLRHVAELLDAARRDGVTDPLALARWLDARRHGAGQDESQRRLETDAAAVRMLTVHQAKGLQFPVVYLPQAADRYVMVPQPGDPFAFHDDQGRRRLDLGMADDPGRAANLERHAGDEAAEQLRVLYVALTRAACHVTAWWVPTKQNLTASALHRVLASKPGRPVEPSAPEPLGDPRRLDLPSGVTAEPIPHRDPVQLGLKSDGQPPDLRSFTRQVDRTWRRTSYSALTLGADHAPAGPADETEPDLAAPAAADPALDRLSPMAELPGGTGFGSLVHAVFEYADPSDPDQFAAVTAAAVERAGLAGVGPAELAAALEPGLRTGLGPIADGLALADLPLSDRLAELSFELPLAHQGEPVTIGRLADALALHLAADDPLAAYPERLRTGVPEAALRGYLTGSIDAVLRLGDPRRHLVVDYKTNRLAPPGEPLTLGCYTPARLAEAMMASHYPLQALFYTVALHRFLRWRLKGYDPDSALGGIAYLFVRGMAGPDTPSVAGLPCGVFAWRPPTALILALDDVLAGRGGTA